MLKSRLLSAIGSVFTIYLNGNNIALVHSLISHAIKLAWLVVNKNYSAAILFYKLKYNARFAIFFFRNKKLVVRNIERGNLLLLELRIAKCDNKNRKATGLAIREEWNRIRI